MSKELIEKCNVLAQRVEKLEADRDALAGISKELIERLREAAAQRVASTAMIGADDLIAAADALEIATAGMNAYWDELGSCRKAAGFGSADDPMAQEGFGAFSDPLCVAAFVESQFKRIVAERAALAAELNAVRGDQTPTTDDINLQNWKGMDGVSAFRLIGRRADDWNHVARLMNAWLEANREDLVSELKALEPKCPSYMPDWHNHGAAIADPVFQQIRGIMGTQNFGQDDALRQAVLHALRTFESGPKPGAFRIGDLVKKVSGSAWEGRIVGTYSTALTPEGYAVESASHPGSVQIYPAKALTLVIQEAGIQPTEGQHAQHVDVSGENVNATFRISKQTGADALVGLRGCNSRHGGMWALYPCIYRMRTTDPGCTGCVERDEDQPAEAGHEND